jgi:hypothetical protein
MKRTLKIPELTSIEKQRLLEIDLYLMVTRLFDQMGDKLETHEFIETLANSSKASISVVKTVITSIRNPQSQLRPSKDELVTLLYRSGKPVSQICRIANTTPNTVYNYINNMYRHETIPEFTPKLKPEILEQVEKFTKKLKVITNYDEYRV